MIKRSFKILVELAAIAMVGLTVLVVFAAVRLSMGPIELAFLTPHIERGLNAEKGNFRVTLGGTVLSWSQQDRDLDLIVKNVQVSKRSGGQQAFFPEIAIGLSIRALLVGEFRPTRFEFFRPRLKLVRGMDGQIDFVDPSLLPSSSASGQDAATDSRDGADVPVGGDISETVIGSLLTRPPPGHPLHYLKSINLTEAALEFEDERTNFRMTSPASHLALVRNSNGIAVSAQLSLTANGISAPIDITGGYRAATKNIVLIARFENLELARLSNLAEVLGPLAAIRFPANGRLGVTMKPHGEIESITLDADAGAGKLAIDGVFSKPIDVRGLRIKGRADNGLQRFQLDHLTADLGGPKIGIKGHGQRKGGETTLAFDVTVRDVSIPDLKRLWPKGAAPGAREWITENVDEGQIAKAGTHVDLTLAHGPGGKLSVVNARRIDGDFEYANLKIHYLRPLPPITGLSGRATVGKDAISFEGGGATVAGLSLDDGKVNITGLDRDKGELLKIEAVARGPLPAALALLSHPRLDLLKGFGVNPAEVEGEMATRLSIELPLLKGVTFDMVELVAAANLRGVKVPKVALDSDVTDGELTLQVDKKGMDVAGTIRLGGVPASLAWTENFNSGASFRGRYKVKGVIDDAGRRKLGLSSEPHVTGPLGFDLIVSRFDDKRTGIGGTLDVKPSALVFDEIEWSKKPGIGGYAQFSMNIEDGKVRRIPNLVVKAGDLDAIGSVNLAADGITVQNFKFSKLKFGESDIQVSGRARTDGGLDLTVTGASVDVQPFLESRRKEGVKRPLSIKVDLDQARVGPGPPISSVRGTLSRTTGDWQNMNITGRVGKNGKPVLLRITPGKNSRKLTITSSDAGATLRSMDINEDMIGGQLKIEGTYDDTKPGAPLTGILRVKKFQMVRAPLMAKVLGVLSLGGVMDALSGKGISFDELEAPFIKTGDDLRLRDARAYGGALGFTAKGWVDLEKDELDIRGTVVPAYTFNKLLGYIPLLGTLLVGEKGSGVFAATYRMYGPLAGPQVSTNPLATLTPGFLRGLFKVFETPSKKPLPGQENFPSEPEKTYEPLPRQVE